jgi:hypothetical protein
MFVVQAVLTFPFDPWVFTLFKEKRICKLMLYYYVFTVQFNLQAEKLLKRFHNFYRKRIRDLNYCIVAGFGFCVFAVFYGDRWPAECELQTC